MVLYQVGVEYWLYAELTKHASDPAAFNGTADDRYADMSEVSVAVNVEDVKVVGEVPSDVIIMDEEKASGFTEAELETIPGRAVNESELVDEVVPVFVPVDLVVGDEVELYEILTP